MMYKEVDKKERPVAADLYTREYFLGDCEGYRPFLEQKGRVLSNRLENFYKRLAVKPDDRVLEIACGRGEICNLLASRVRSVVGTDYAVSAIAICQEAYRDSGHKNLQFVVADAKALPFPDNSFDLVFCSEFLEHVHDWELREVMKEIVRVLTPNGRLIAQTEPNRVYRFVSSVWSFLPRLIQSLRKGRKITFLLERPAGHIQFHVNEQTYWSVRRLIQHYFYEWRVETYEMVLNMNLILRFIFNGYPLNRLPLLRRLFDREIFAYAARPKKAG